MRHPLLVLISLIFLMISVTGFTSLKMRSIFNGRDLSGWDVYIGPLYDSVKGDFTGDPIGLNKDPQRVFSVVKEDGKPAIRISGENFGGLSTQQEFTNYHLRLQFKWGKSKWGPKRNAKRDSGILYHAVGPHAADWLFWMRSQEFQIQEGDCGDYWGCGGALADVPAAKQGDNKFIYTVGAPLLTFRDKGPMVGTALNGQIPKNLPVNGTPLTCIVMAIRVFTSLMGPLLWFCSISGSRKGVSTNR